MPLERGPFRMVDDGAVAVSAGTWDFTNDAIALATQVQSNTVSWDDFILDAGDLATDPLDDLEGFDIGAVSLATSYASDWSLIPNVDSAIAAFADTDTALGIAVSFAPAQAWQDPPGPFVPPGSVLNLTPPTVPIDAFNPVTTGTVGDQSGTTRPTVQLWNFTRIGALNFVEGDTFQLALLGNPGQAVSVGGAFNGATLDVSSFGQLDQLGNLGLQGVMGPENVGAWHEDWYFDGQLVKSFDFIVSPANA